MLRVSNNTASSPRFPQRIPSLDGLRALSIILVLAGHLRGTRGAPVFLNSKIDVGYLGVRMFFVISGFIITHLLLKKECNGGISIGQFWIRRSLRIFPSAYTYMLTILLASLIGLVAMNGKDLGLGRHIYYQLAARPRVASRAPLVAFRRRAVLSSLASCHAQPRISPAAQRCIGRDDIFASA